MKCASMAPHRAGFVVPFLMGGATLNASFHTEHGEEGGGHSRITVLSPGLV